MEDGEIERLLQRLEASISEQEGYLESGAVDLLTKHAEQNQEVLARLAFLSDGARLPQGLLGRLQDLAARAGVLESKAEARLTLLRQEIAEVAIQRQTLAFYGAAQRWPGAESTFLNQKR